MRTLSHIFAAGLSLLMIATNAFASSTHELQQMNTRWHQAFAEKDTGAFSSLYTNDAWTAQYPYQPNSELVGVDAISQMFANGPFMLPGGVIDTQTVALDTSGDTGLILKKWQLSFDTGAFSGLAVKVATQQEQWLWDIELSGGGINTLAGFASQDYEADTSAFDGVAQRLSTTPHNVWLVDATTTFAKPTEQTSISSVNNLLAIEHGANGLLIANVQSNGQSFVSLIALEKIDGIWQPMVQFMQAQ